MIDILPVLVKATATTRSRMKQWFERYPVGMPWTVVSDYCIDDKNKPNDVLSFVIIANHDTADNICKYIAGVAPKDLKNTNKVPLGLVQYLTCPQPVTFSISFVLQRHEALLRAYLKVEDMAEFVPDAIAYLESRLALYQSAEDIEYHHAAIKRFKAFGRDLAHKNVNAKLARQMHLAAAAAATVFNMVNQATGAKWIRWISDRDALIERNDTVVYDLANIYYQRQAIEFATPQQIAGLDAGMSLATLSFELPERTGKHRFDELVRLPDYLAGTLADLRSDTMTFSLAKFDTVLNNVFVNSPNNWVVHLLSDDEKITVRSAQLRD